MKRVFFMSFIGLLVMLVGFISCSKDDSNSDHPDYSKLNIINNGGAVNTIVEDPNNTEPLAIVQTIPSFDGMNYSPSFESKRPGVTFRSSKAYMKANDAGNTFPANIPIMFFFNNKIYLNSIENNFTVTVGGTEVKGTIVVNVTPKGNAIITFTPWTEFSANNNVTITINKDMQSGGGIGMLEDLVLTYATTQSQKGNFDDNKGFEKGDDGVFFAGDGAVRTGTTGSLAPYEGNKYAAISSGEALVSDNGYAIGSASSIMVLGPINTNISTLSFYYDFISAEFNDYVDSEFDDCAIVTVYGPKGAYSELVSSVNTVRFDNQPFVGFPNMPDAGDDYAGHTNWLPFTISASKMGSIGTPAYIVFTVTDVADQILSSILAVDNLSY